MTHTDRFARPRHDASAEHGIVYRNENQFCGWVFYCGLWQVADGSVVAGFKRVQTSYDAYDNVDHGQIARKKGHLVTIRSRDGGASWDPSSVTEVFDMDTARAEDLPGGGADDWSGLPPIDFASRDTLIMGGGIPALFARNAQAWLRASTDGGRSWRRPILLPQFELGSLTHFGSSMYATRADGVHLLGLQTNAPDALSPRPLVYGTTDGSDWQFLSFMTPERPPSPYYVLKSPFSPLPHFYPRLIVLRDGRVLASLRYQRDARNVIWTDIHESLDGGRTWAFLSRVNDWGAPGDIVEMADGRIVCVYGYRLMPSGIRYRVSEDGGRSWGSEMILRDDGGSWDLGYPRVIEIAPNRLLTVYYMNLASDPVQMNGGVRHIARTVFTP
ncbi:sialidase family protein [Sphingomonas canadensis]|uniref:Sialidase family protein n=1 Tax=Sphingomonas canadensis TaxID=1219257 RepID=A0ABW3H708_9SPHN|nr:sialidase family protein [Sphingomonas canadensis]MCW3835610.1 glycoside hydrolase [Sphingomonas canadensis]